MSYLLFIDESGHDGRESPYYVLAGICIEDKFLWKLICKIQDVEEEFFGCRISEGALELKGKKLLNRKTFRLAGQLPQFNADERRTLAYSCLQKGIASHEKDNKSGATKKELTALGQAKIAFVQRILELCIESNCKAMASIVNQSAPKPAEAVLRKDYSYLLQRFFNFLKNHNSHNQGLVIFDELEKSQCHLLVNQMTRYFRDTAKGKYRSSRIIPEPFFVHSDLTTAIQIVDLIAYIISFGVRFHFLTEPMREELTPLAELVMKMRAHHIQKAENGESLQEWGFKYISDLRPRKEKGFDEGINRKRQCPPDGSQSLR